MIDYDRTRQDEYAYIGHFSQSVRKSQNRGLWRWEFELNPNFTQIALALRQFILSVHRKCSFTYPQLFCKPFLYYTSPETTHPFKLFQFMPPLSADYKYKQILSTLNLFFWNKRYLLCFLKAVELYSQKSKTISTIQIVMVMNWGSILSGRFWLQIISASALVLKIE